MHSDDSQIADAAFAFITRCRREDGGYASSPDPDYAGLSDTAASDLAAATYAAVLARSMGRELPDASASGEFIQRHQRPDGRFVNHEGSFDPRSDLATLYNTTQGVVALRALGARPAVPPAPVMDRFFEGDAFKRLPWYTTSFFPLFYTALDLPFPPAYKTALRQHMLEHQTDDGYLGGHVAAAFHMAHFFRLIREPVPRAAEMVVRTLRDQTPAGGWDIKHPDWDVHACFDAVFILRQLGEETDHCREAIRRAAVWAASCQNADGGFGHYPGRHSDMDAVYFQLATLLQAGSIPGMPAELPDGHVLGWGHAVLPGRQYRI